MNTASITSAAWRFFYVQIWRRLKLVWLILRAWLFNLLVGLDTRVVDGIFAVLFSQADHCVKSIQHDDGKGAISRVIDRYRAGKKQLWSL
jgi:hypothetical protein